MKISETVVDLSAALKKEIKIEVGKDGTPKVTAPDDLFIKTLPANLSLDTAKELHAHTSNFYTAAAQAVGDLSLEAMEKHKNLSAVEVKFPMIEKDNFTVFVDREKKGPVPGKPGETYASYGVLSTKLETVSAGTNVGEMRHVREELKKRAAKLFST